MKQLPKEEVKRNVIEQLTRNYSINANDIHVEVEDEKVILKGTVNMQVDVENGNVTLSGSVSHSRERSKAEDIANSVKGVVDVKNEIKVKPSSVRKDEEIEKEIKREYERNPLIDSNNVFVEVKKGVVNLSGSVANRPIWNEIHEKAPGFRGLNEPHIKKFTRVRIHFFFLDNLFFALPNRFLESLTHCDSRAEQEYLCVPAMCLIRF